MCIRERDMYKERKVNYKQLRQNSGREWWKKPGQIEL
jgi:hypothetical protein